MKKLISLLLVFLLTFSLCACGAAETQEDNATQETTSSTIAPTEPSEDPNLNVFQVGFNRQSILPSNPIGVQIAGGDAANRICSGFQDEVSATCIAFSKNGETYLVYTCDFMVLYDSIIAPVKSAISGATGVPYENILINCTHTHSGVNILSLNWNGAQEYRDLFSKRCVKAAEKAIKDLTPATISYGSTLTEGLTFVRHYNKVDGTTYGNGHGTYNGDPETLKENMYAADTELQLIRFTREGEKDIVIASFPCHATTVNATNITELSACFPGVFRETMEAEQGVHCAFFQGASGDQIPFSYVKGISKVWPQNHRTFGKLLAEYAMGIEMKPMADDALVFNRWEYTGKSMKEGADDIIRVNQARELQNLAASLGGYSHPKVTEKAAEYGFSNYLDANGLAKRADAPDTRTMKLVAMQLGSEVSMVFAPYEMFGMHGKYIKDNSPFEMDFIVTCSEDYQGYFPHLQGCEESFYEYDVTMYERGSGEKLAEIFANTLTEMKNAG